MLKTQHKSRLGPWEHRADPRSLLFSHTTVTVLYYSTVPNQYIYLTSLCFFFLSLRSERRQRPCGLQMDRVWWKRTRRKKRAAPTRPGTLGAKHRRRGAKQEAGWRGAKMNCESPNKPDRLKQNKLEYIFICVHSSGPVLQPKTGTLHQPWTHDFFSFWPHGHTLLVAFLCKAACLYILYLNCIWGNMVLSSL